MLIATILIFFPPSSTSIISTNYVSPSAKPVPLPVKFQSELELQCQHWCQQTSSGLSVSCKSLCQWEIPSSAPSISTTITTANRQCRPTGYAHRPPPPFAFSSSSSSPARFFSFCLFYPLSSLHVVSLLPHLRLYLLFSRTSVDLLFHLFFFLISSYLFVSHILPTHQQHVEIIPERCPYHFWYGTTKRILRASRWHRPRSHLRRHLPLSGQRCPRASRSLRGTPS